MRRQMILMLSDVKKLFGELKGLLLGEAKRLLGAHVQMTHIEPSDEVLAWIDERMERTMVQLTLSLELMPDFHGIVERLAAAGSPVSLEELRRFLAWAADDPTRQIGVAAAQRGLAARGDGDAIHVEETAMGDLYKPGPDDYRALARATAHVDLGQDPPASGPEGVGQRPSGDADPSQAARSAGHGAGATRPASGLRVAAGGSALDG